MSMLFIRRKKPKPKRRKRAPRRRKPQVDISERVGSAASSLDRYGSDGDAIAAEEATIAAEEERRFQREQTEYEMLQRKGKIIDVASIMLGLVLVGVGGALSYIGYGKGIDEEGYRVGGPALAGVGGVLLLLGLMGRVMTIETPEVDEE